MKKRIFELIQIGNSEDRSSKIFDIFISVTIILNIAVLFLETFDEMSSFYNILHLIEIITIVIFCVEYALRIWTSCLFSFYPALLFSACCGSSGSSIYSGLTNNMIPFM